MPAMAQRTLELAGLALAILLLLRFTPPAMRAWRVYAGVRTRRLADAGPLEIAPTGPVAAILDQLRPLGFSRIGECSLALPTGTTATEWLWADETGSTYVAVVPSRVRGAFMACYTAFGDWAWLQTNYPRGERTDRPTYVARGVDSSPAAAVVAHRAEIERLRPVHGAPRPVRTMADSLRMDAEYRTRHGGVTLRRLTFRIMSPAFAAAGLAIICGLLLLLGR
jgi:hypothetical protein